jgi:hypothetical protein
MHRLSTHPFAFLAATACALCSASLAAQEPRRDVTTAVPVAPQQAADPAAAAVGRAGIIVVGGRAGDGHTAPPPATGTALNPQPLPPRPAPPVTGAARPAGAERAGIIVVGGRAGQTGPAAAEQPPAPRPRD